MEPCLSTQRSPPQPRIRMETIELVTFRDTQTLSGTFTIGKCGLVIFLISEGIWQLICSNLQMYNSMNFWSRLTSVWVEGMPSFLLMQFSWHSSRCLCPPNDGKCNQRTKPDEDPLVIGSYIPTSGGVSLVCTDMAILAHISHNLIYADGKYFLSHTLAIWGMCN